MENLLPITVRASLNHVLHQAFYPEGEDYVKCVYILGVDRYNIFADLSSDEKKLISFGNFLWKGELFVMNQDLSSLKMFGPFTMEEIFRMERCHVWTTSECLDFLLQFKDIEMLSKTKGWEIFSNGQIASNDFPPPFIRKSLLQTFKHNQEVYNCEGVILVPGEVSRERFDDERIVVMQKEGCYIVK